MYLYASKLKEFDLFSFYFQWTLGLGGLGLT